MQDARFATQKARSENYHALYGMLEEITRTKTTADWLALLKPLHIPVTKTNRLDDLMDDPHLKHHRLLRALRTPRGGRLLEHEAAAAVLQNPRQRPPAPAAPRRAYGGD